MSFPLKPGDRVTRVMAGIHLPMLVREVKDGVITCDAINDDGSIFPGGWTFSAEHGGEIDEDLGWNPPETPTGSYLIYDEDTRQ